LSKIVYNQTIKGYDIDWLQLENVCYATFHGSAGRNQHISTCISPFASNKLLFGVESLLAV
jgi:hypothetical protein